MILQHTECSTTEINRLRCRVPDVYVSVTDQHRKLRKSSSLQTKRLDYTESQPEHGQNDHIQSAGQGAHPSAPRQQVRVQRPLPARRPFTRPLRRRSSLHTRPGRVSAEPTGPRAAVIKLGYAYLHEYEKICQRVRENISRGM
jgi:hypothetical protein